MAHKDSRVRLKSLSLKQVNVPHTEHRGLGTNPENVENLPQKVVFDSRGEVEVSRAVADALLEFYPKQVEELPAKPRS